MIHRRAGWGRSEILDGGRFFSFLMNAHLHMCIRPHGRWGVKWGVVHMMTRAAASRPPGEQGLLVSVRYLLR